MNILIRCLFLFLLVVPFYASADPLIFDYSVNSNAKTCLLSNNTAGFNVRPYHFYSYDIPQSCELQVSSVASILESYHPGYFSYQTEDYPDGSYYSGKFKMRWAECTSTQVSESPYYNYTLPSLPYKYVVTIVNTYNYECSSFDAQGFPLGCYTIISREWFWYIAASTPQTDFCAGIPSLGLPGSPSGPPDPEYFPCVDYTAGDDTFQDAFDESFEVLQDSDLYSLFTVSSTGSCPIYSLPGFMGVSDGIAIDAQCSSVMTNILYPLISAMLLTVASMVSFRISFL